MRYPLTQVTYTDNTATCYDYLTMENIHLRPTTSSWEIMLTEESNPLSPYAYCSATKLNTLKTFSFFVGTTNACQSTECMDFMMNARDDITSNYGRYFAIALIACLLLQSLMKKFYACMGDLAQSYPA